MAGENYLFEFMEMLLLALEAERVELRHQTSHVQDPPFPGHAAGRLLVHLHVLSLVLSGRIFCGYSSLYTGFCQGVSAPQSLIARQSQFCVPI